MTLDAPILSQGVRLAIKKGLRHAAIAFSYRPMLQRTLLAGFIAPCLPTKTDKLPAGGAGGGKLIR